MSLSGDLESLNGAEDPENERVQMERTFFLERTESPAPSYESMKTDDDRLEHDIDFSEEPCSTMLRVQSAGSQDQPTKFIEGAIHTEPRSKTTVNPYCHASVDSLNSEDTAMECEESQSRMDLPFIFKSIQNTLKKLLAHQFVLFKRQLYKHYKKYFDSPMEDHDVLDVVDKMLERCGKGGALKIALDILQNLKQMDLAESLEKICKRTKLQHELKIGLKRRYDSIFEGIPRQGQQTYLSCVYADLSMTVGGSVGVNGEHELRQIETAPGNENIQETAINCRDILKPLSDLEKPVRTVMTTGIAGIGLTVCVQRFILDWVEDTANQDIQFVFPFPFRELNLVGHADFSLMDLICIFYPDMKEMDFIEKKDCKVLLIFEGLDECAHPLDFQKNESLSGITEPTTIDMLLTNLIRGNLLPNAQVWITSRSAAAVRIPPECVHRATVLRGFNDLQKEEYFSKKFNNQTQVSKVMEHIMASRSLYIMCHIPVFCWILASVLEHKLFRPDARQVNTTEFYTHYLLLQTHMKNQKFDKSKLNTHMWIEADREFIFTLGKLAFQLLENERFVFFEDDLAQYGLDVKKVAVQSGLCTEVFREDLCQDREFCFVHLSIQEYLAALYVYLSFVNCNKNVLEPYSISSLSRLFFFKEISMADLFKVAVDRALQSRNGHLDLFLRFLLGLSIDSTQSLLEGLMTQTKSGSSNTEETVNYIRKMIEENAYPARCRNLPYCLKELGL